MKLKKKEFEDLKQGSMTVSEYVTRFTQLSRYVPDNMDTNEKKQDWFLNGLNDDLAYALEARDFVNFQDMVDKALVLENRREIMEQKRKMQRTGSQGSTLDSVLVHHHKDLFFDLVSRVDNPECKLQVRDFKLLSDRFSAPTSNLLALHCHHLRETTLDRVPWHVDSISTVGRMGISLTGVHRSSRT
jgi:hypothetical protein